MSTIERMNQLGKYTERGLGSHSAVSSSDADLSLMKNIATSLTLYGPDSEEGISLLNRPPTGSSNNTQTRSILSGTVSWSTPFHSQNLYHSPISVNGYYRSTCLKDLDRGCLNMRSFTCYRGHCRVSDQHWYYFACVTLLYRTGLPTSTESWISMRYLIF